MTKKRKPTVKSEDATEVTRDNGGHALESAGAMSTSLDVEAIERELDIRKKLADRERQHRIEEYEKAVIECSDTVGAELFGVRGRPKRQKLPVRILAEGDSWFDFPLGGGLLKKGDVIAQLATLIPFPILNIAVRGDEVRQMLGVEQRQRLEALLQNKDYDFNTLLFSGGGNDIVGNPFCLWLRSHASVQGDHTQAVDEPALAHALGIIQTGYEQLFDLRDEILSATPNRRIVVIIHGYDFAVPSGKGVCGYGPWLKPSLDYRGWTNPTQAKSIVKNVLSRLSGLLMSLASRRHDVFFVETQGTLAAKDWNDELHPKGPGFKQIAIKFVDKLREVYPNDIP